MKPALNKDKELIEELNLLIQNKLDWGDASQWTHHQFEELSERIKKTTGILLSVNTLKRFFGRIKTSSFPNKTTLNTLAQFGGFKSYYDFAERNSGQQNAAQKTNGNTGRKTSIKRIAITAIVIILITGGVLLSRYIQKEKSYQEATFSQTYEEGFVPFTQIFKYNVDPILGDSIYFNEYFKGAIGVSPNDSVFGWMHFVPGFRKVRFSANGKTMWESTYMVKTDGWLYIFPWGGLEPRKYIPLENMRGQLTVSQDLLDANKIDPEVENGWIHFFNARYFNADGNNFTLEVTIKNELQSGFQQCQDAVIAIECELYNFEVHFTQSGCQKYAELKLGDATYGGIQNDLTNLTFNMNEWQKIRLTSENGKFSVYNEDKLLIEKSYSGNPGELTMLRFSFRGKGEIDKVGVFDGQGNLRYSDDFE